MSDRIFQISVYFSKERKEEIKQRAKEEDVSMSIIVNDMVDWYLQQEAHDAIASETQAEERIQELIAVGTESMRETAKETRERHKELAIYVIAIFELLTRDQSSHVEKEALKTGATRMGQDLDTIIQDIEESITSTETESEPLTKPQTDTTSAGTDDNVENEEDTSDSETDTIHGSDLFDQLRNDQE